MSFISLQYVALMATALLVFYLAGKRYRKAVLLVFSCIFIGYYHLQFLCIAIGVSLWAYAAGHYIEKTSQSRWHKPVYVGSLAAMILFWIFCRNSATLLDGAGFLFPLGISFYTFQALSYVTEIYWGEEKAETSVLDFMLYMLLFMKFISGPIERSRDLLPQLHRMQPASYEMMTMGMKIMFVGLFKKIVIADRLGIYIDPVFDAPQSHASEQLIAACLVYPIYLYADFSGYTDIAIGCARLFGLKLSPNFDRPFIAQSTAELWRRWHMSLSFWVRDYIYYPLSAAMRRWGLNGILLSVVITFVLLGVWHGVGLSFVVYGLIQGLSIAYEMKAKKMRDALGQRLGKSFKVWSVMRMYLLFAFSLIFFRCAGIKDAWYFVTHMFASSADNWAGWTLGIPVHYRCVILIAVALMLVYEYLQARYDLLKRIEKMRAVWRWSIYYVLILAFLAYGKIGADNFVYVQF